MVVARFEAPVHYAVIGCIHGNFPALQATMEDIRSRGVERIVCLGDVVGHGPQPLECIDVVRSSCFITIRGDHDEAMILGSQGFIPKTARVLEWTREQIQSSDQAAERMEFLETTHDSFNSAGIAFHHGSPRSCHEYLFPSDVTKDPRKLRTAFTGVDKVCFHAHTHVPGVIVEDPLGWVPAQELDNYYHYKKGQRALVNVGSVGQPRDGDRRACYLEIQKNEMYWRRVEYDVDAVVQRLEALSDVFTSDLAIRLQKGR